MPNTNDLRDSIEVWKYKDSDNAGGTPVNNFVLYRKKFAKVKFNGGATTNDGLGNLPYTNADFTIRYDPNVTYKCNVIFESTRWQINHIEVLNREDWMVLNCIAYNEKFD